MFVLRSSAFGEGGCAINMLVELFCSCRCILQGFFRDSPVRLCNLARSWRRLKRPQCDATSSFSLPHSTHIMNNFFARAQPQHLARRHILMASWIPILVFSRKMQWKTDKYTDKPFIDFPSCPREYCVHYTASSPHHVSPPTSCVMLHDRGLLGACQKCASSIWRCILCHHTFITTGPATRCRGHHFPQYYNHSFNTRPRCFPSNTFRSARGRKACSPGSCSCLPRHYDDGLQESPRSMYQRMLVPELCFRSKHSGRLYLRRRQCRRRKRE